MTQSPPISGTLPGMESLEENPPASPSRWLAELESRVAQAVAEIGRLRQENKRLEREIAKLKKGAASGEAAAGWERERTEVRDRVERLARRLEELLGPGAAEELRTGRASSTED
jgi:chromosome segregation ATPase